MVIAGSMGGVDDVFKPKIQPARLGCRGRFPWELRRSFGQAETYNWPGFGLFVISVKRLEIKLDDADIWAARGSGFSAFSPRLLQIPPYSPRGEGILAY